jgi:hypothetical protein
LKAKPANFYKTIIVNLSILHRKITTPNSDIVVRGRLQGFECTKTFSGTLQASTSEWLATIPREGLYSILHQLTRTTVLTMPLNGF